MPSEILIPLTQAKTGACLHLVKIEGGREVTRRLVELGLTPGVSVRVLQNYGGPVLIAVRDSRIALGRGIASKLQVSTE